MRARIKAGIKAGVLLGLAVGASSMLLGCESGGAMQILDVNPRVGHTQGDQSVRILGRNFRPDIGYTVYFGTKKTSSVTIRDPETLEVVTPSGMSVGPVDIMIRADDGNAFKIAQAFKFENMGGSVVEGLGSGTVPGGQPKGNLAY
jgi:hypothetical protein